MADNKPSGGPLAGPASVLLAGRSPLGPFRGWGRRLVPVPQAAVPFVNIGAATLNLHASADNPVRDTECGTRTEGAVTAELEPDLAPGAVAELRLTGSVPSRPGRYQSAVRIEAGLAEPLLLSIAIEVSASPVWALLLILLGLTAAGAGAVLSVAGDLRAKQTEVHELRQSFLERQARDPLPRRMQGDAAAIERDYDLALKELTRPTPLGFADHRSGDAKAYLADAAARRAELDKDLTAHAPRDAEIEDLLALWEIYKAVAADLRNMPPDAPTGGAISFPTSVSLYLDRFVQRFVPGRVDYDKRQLEQVVLGVRLAASADRAQEAHERAQAARRWIGRGLDNLASARALVQDQRQLGMNLVSDAAQIERALADAGLPAEITDPTRRRLDEAAALLARPAPDGHTDDLAFRDANRAVHEAGTELIRAEAARMSAAFKAATVAPDGEDGLADINAAVAREQANPPHEPAEKIAGLRRIMGAWASKLAALPAAPDHTALDTAANAVVAALDAGDLSQVSPRYRALTNAWSGWDTRRTIQAANATLRPGCDRLARLTDVQLSQLTEGLRQMAPRPERAAWETQAADAAHDLARYDPDAPDGTSCVGPLNEIGERLFRLGTEMFRAGLDDAPIPRSVKLAALRQAGLGDVETSFKPLGLVIQTPGPERVNGREIRFVLQGSDPAWTETDRLSVDFGDATPPFLATLGEVRHGTEIVHRYETTRAGEVVATLTSARAGSPRLAEVRLPLALAPSPASAARWFEDIFVNTRFALSLVIALTVYTWRFQSGKTVFGARGFDYVEAFATGFVVSAAVSNLPAELPRLLANAGGG